MKAVSGVDAQVGRGHDEMVVFNAYRSLRGFDIQYRIPRAVWLAGECAVFTQKSCCFGIGGMDERIFVKRQWRPVGRSTWLLQYPLAPAHIQTSRPFRRRSEVIEDVAKVHIPFDPKTINTERDDFTQSSPHALHYVLTHRENCHGVRGGVECHSAYLDV